VWRDPEDDLNDPLACELFSPRFAPDPQLSFTYEIETPADGKNPDEGLVKLRDGRAVKPARDGVGFEGDAIVKLDLGGLRNVAGVELECFTKRRPAAKWRAVPKDLYNTVRLAVSTSEDGKSWSEWHDSHRARGLAGGGKLLALRFSATCRYMRVKAVKQENVNRQLLAAMLEDAYDLALAETGEEAQALVRENFNTLSLVLLDLILPDMHGLEILRWIKENSHLARIPVIVLTDERPGGRQSEEPVPNGILSYPFTFSCIKKIILDTLDTCNIKERTGSVSEDE
jgi:CheY-like chemotaxis protein